MAAPDRFPPPRGKNDAECRTGEPMHVLFGANAAYLQHTAVCIASLAESNAAHEICVHILTCDADGPEEELLRRTVRSYPRLTLQVHRVAPERLEGLFVDRYFSKEVYLRMLAPEILPASVGRYIYLDSDTLVVDDLGDLWVTDLGTNLIGAVIDLDVLGLLRDRFENIGVGPDDCYINSGVMLVDADCWRREDVTRRLVEFAVDRGSRLKFVDQDAINGLLQGRIEVLDYRWNLQVISYGWRVRRHHRDYYEASREARRNPAVLHYTSGSKPWNFRAWCNKKSLYYRFRDRTAWRNARPPHLSPAQRVEYDIARALLKLGVDVYMVLQVARTLAEKAAAMSGSARRVLAARAHEERSAGHARD